MCVCKAGDMYVYGVSNEEAKRAYNLNCDLVNYNNEGVRCQCSPQDFLRNGGGWGKQ